MAVLHSAVHLFAANRIGASTLRLLGRAIKITPLSISFWKRSRDLQRLDIAFAALTKRDGLVGAKAFFADEGLALEMTQLCLRSQG
jgi:hypothetical protein